jgi:hypothetical protein
LCFIKGEAGGSTEWGSHIGHSTETKRTKEYSNWRNKCPSYLPRCDKQLVIVFSIGILTNRRIEDYCVAWRKGLRKLWKLPYESRSLNVAVVKTRCSEVGKLQNIGWVEIG